MQSFGEGDRGSGHTSKGPGGSVGYPELCGFQRGHVLDQNVLSLSKALPGGIFSELAETPKLPSECFSSSSTFIYRLQKIAQKVLIKPGRKYGQPDGRGLPDSS